MGLPWVRLDCNIATHDKVLTLLEQRDGYRAMTLYLFGLAYAGGHLTDGFVPKSALGVLHGTEKHARMLIDHRLWHYDENNRGYRIHNFDQRQELEVIAEAKRAARRLAAKKGGCVKNHGPDCGCWKNELGSA